MNSFVFATTPRTSRRAVGFTFGALLLLAALTHGAATSDATAPQWKKQVLTDKYFCDGITAGDINRDGQPDIVAGPFWYEGPGFTNQHEFYPAQVFPTEPSPTDSMFSFVHDFNGDGWPDILVLGRVHLHQAFWYENPQGKAGAWKKHFVFERIKGESPAFQDVDGDGIPELVAHDGARWGLIQPEWKNPTNAWRFKPITAEGKFEQFYHGTGIGDINGDGWMDLILNEGWFEQPADRDALWVRHEFKFGEKGGAQIFALDADGDGDTDVVTAIDAHGWGLAWFEQIKENGNITFRKHTIMGSRAEESQFGVAFSQPHALDLADLDGDGLPDLIVGKRMWAHGPKGDIEPMAEPVLYWFRLVREGKTARFEPHLIDRASGVGVQVTAADVNGDGRRDILTVSKLGAFVFLNESPKRAALAFPGKDWEIATPESQGVDSVRLQKAVALLDSTIGSNGVHELVIVRNGRMIWHGDDIDKVHGIWSFTKVFTSTALGLLIDDGKCTLATKAKDILPAMAAKYPEVTLQHFATMTSGYRAVGDETASYKHGASVTPFDPNPTPLFTPPGSHFAYWDSAMNQFANVLTHIAGESLEELFQRRIADPIGMNRAHWDWGDWGKVDGVVVNGGSGNKSGPMKISAREAARLGLLFLNRGKWNGKQLISEHWVEEATQMQVPATVPHGFAERANSGPGEYGFNWWINGIKPDGKRKFPGAPPRTYCGAGHNNNYCFVIPEWNMVIVRLGLDGSAKDKVWSDFLAKVGEAIIL